MKLMSLLFISLVIILFLLISKKIVVIFLKTVSTIIAVLGFMVIIKSS